jgi:hypothetical protein
MSGIREKIAEYRSQEPESKRKWIIEGAKAVFT